MLAKLSHSYASQLLQVLGKVFIRNHQFFTQKVWHPLPRINLQFLVNLFFRSVFRNWRHLSALELQHGTCLRFSPDIDPLAVKRSRACQRLFQFFRQSFAFEKVYRTMSCWKSKHKTCSIKTVVLLWFENRAHAHVHVPQRGSRCWVTRVVFPVQATSGSLKREAGHSSSRARMRRLSISIRYVYCEFDSFKKCPSEVLSRYLPLS